MAASATGSGTVESGAYLTDGMRLLWVSATRDGELLLEDCFTDEADWWAVGKALTSLWLVRRERELSA